VPFLRLVQVHRKRFLPARADHGLSRANPKPFLRYRAVSECLRSFVLLLWLLLPRAGKHPRLSLAVAKQNDYPADNVSFEGFNRRDSVILLRPSVAGSFGRNGFVFVGQFVVVNVVDVLRVRFPKGNVRLKDISCANDKRETLQ
jgi:hypothetical protein